MNQHKILNTTAKWIVTNWKDEYVFPRFLNNTPEKFKKELIKKYIFWSLRSGDINKAFKASKQIEYKISKQNIESAKKYIIQNGFFGRKRKYLLKKELSEFKENGIEFSQSELYILLKKQVFRFNELLEIFEFCEFKSNPVETYLNLYKEMCELAIKEKDYSKFITSFYSLIDVPLPDKAMDLIPKQDSFYLSEAKSFFGKFNKYSEKFKQKSLKKLKKDVDAWLTELIELYPDLIKNNKKSISYTHSLGELAKKYFRNFKPNNKLLNLMGELLISNNTDIHPWNSLFCFEKAKNKKRIKELQIFKTRRATELINLNDEELILKTIKYAHDFSKKGKQLIAFRMLEAANELAKKTKIENPELIENLTKNKINLALETLKSSKQFPTMYHQARSIIEDINTLEDKTIVQKVVKEVLKQKPHSYFEYVGELFASFFDLFEREYIISNIMNSLKQKNSIMSVNVFISIRKIQKHLSKKELKEFADKFEKNKNYSSALELHKLIELGIQDPLSQLRRRRPEVQKKENRKLSKKNKQIKILLEKVEKINQIPLIYEINEKTMIEKLEKNSFFIFENRPKPKNRKTINPTKTIIKGDSEFKKTYKFIEQITLLKNKINKLNFDSDINLDKDKYYKISISVENTQKPKLKSKQNDVIVQFNDRRLKYVVNVKLSEATPLQKKLIYYPVLSSIKNTNWPEHLFCGFGNRSYSTPAEY
ncbi:hypothetical protein HON01_11880, partial [Candidatus Woesearchaeota archaeon]|nr:hypothetical protein [Candidatus Woesearchaeota archaeon]